MHTIHIKNLITGSEYHAEFPTEEACVEWHNAKKYVHGDEDANPPTAEVTIEELVTSYDYQSLRKASYPPLADLADALYWQSKGDESKMTEYLARCEEVKALYPKSK